MQKRNTVLIPVPTDVRSNAAPVRVDALPRSTVGFLSTFWPSYEPLVDELGKILRERFEVRATPRVEYDRRPRLADVWREATEWLDDIDAAVVGLGA